MLIGGSTGSTVGAIKLMRVIAFFKGIYRNLREILSPVGAVVPLQKSGQKISENVVEQSGNYITIYLILILVTWSLLCLYGVIYVTTSNSLSLFNCLIFFSLLRKLV